jgi:tetratricopeptide (TPR) repeat protein
MDLKKAIKHQELKDLMAKKQQKGHHDLALELGLEALQISEEWQIYRDMGFSSLKLGNFEDAIKFFKKQVKLLTNAGVLENLFAYKNLIDAQCRAKDYQAAMKTCQKVKLYSLYSEDIHDVPLKNLQLRFSKENMQDIVSQKQVAVKFERYLTYLASVWICLSKAEIFTALDNPTLACHWLDEILTEKSFKCIWTQELKDLGPKDLLVSSFQNSSRESTRASWLVNSFSDCGPYCTKNEGKSTCGQPTICKLFHRIHTVRIVCWENFLDENLESLKMLPSAL